MIDLLVRASVHAAARPAAAIHAALTHAALTPSTPGATPSPSPSTALNPDLVTPGVIGFGITFLIAVAVIFLLIDMVRRIRRMRYREEIAQKLDAEQAVAGGDGDHS